MSRRVKTVRLEGVQGSAGPDAYSDKLLKYIPADIVAAWVAVTALVKASSGVPVTTVLWGAFVIGLALTAGWTWKQTQEPNQPIAVTQIVIATVAFAVWVFALGAPFSSLSVYHPVYGSLFLILYTLIVGLIDP